MKKIGHMWFPDQDLRTPRGTQKAMHMVEHGYYFEALEEALSYVTDWSVAIDGGANVGFWAQKMAEKFEDVYAFEIDKDTFQCMKENCPTVHARNYGLSNKIGKKVLADGWSNKSMGTHLEASVGNNNLIGRAKSARRHDRVEIPTITVDSLNLPSLGFMKLDVEGHEAQVIEGAKETLLKYKPIVMIEYKPLLNTRYGTADPAQRLEELGATFIDKIGKNEVEWIFGWK